MRFGTKCEEGSLPVFSVDTEEDARRLLNIACETDHSGQFIARELLMKQNMKNLQAFSDRLAATWEWMNAPRDTRGPCPRPPPPAWMKR